MGWCGSAGPSRGPVWVGKASWRASAGREALLEGRDWLGGLPVKPVWVGRPFQRAGVGREALLEGWCRSGDLSEG